MTVSPDTTDLAVESINATQSLQAVTAILTIFSRHTLVSFGSFEALVAHVAVITLGSRRPSIPGIRATETLGAWE